MFDKSEQEIMKNWNKDDEVLVSILCMVYNHERYLPKALDSFLMQETNFPFLIVAGEDCSLDNSMKILKEYKQKYPNLIKIVSSENNVGQLENFIRTMNACESEYVAMCDGDDYWTDKHKLQIQIDEMKKHPQCALSFHPAQELYGDRFDKLLAKHHDGNKIFTTAEIIEGDGSFCPTASLVLKKRTFANFPEQFYKEAPFGDHFLQISASLEGGALYIDKVMCIYRKEHEGSWSTETYSNIEKRKTAFEKHMKSMDELNILLDNKYKKEINKIKSKYHYLMAVFFLSKNHLKEFREYIKKANDIYPLELPKPKILYLFRKITPVIKLIKILKT